MNDSICSRAAVMRALSAWCIMRGATNAANNAMIVTTTSISIRVTPASLLLRLTILGPPLHRNLIDTRDGQQDAQDQHADHYAQNQNYHRLEQRGESLDSGPPVRLVNTRHS